MRYAAFLLLALTTASLAQETPPNRDHRLPIPDHVVIVIEENKSFSDVIGSANAPYLNSLAMSGALLTEYYGLHHPSQPNYIELFAGANHDVCTDACVPILIHAPNLATLLLANGKTFGGYAEDLPASPSICRVGEFAQKHCPWLVFKGLPPVSKDFSQFPRSAAGFASLPSVAFVIPNLLHDMHSASISSGSPIPAEVREGDQWLREHLNAYVEWSRTHNSLLIITWDEDSSTYQYPKNCLHDIRTTPPSNHIPTIIVGQPVKPGSRSPTLYTHYNLLRTIEDMYGLQPLANSKSAAPITGIWQ